MFVFYLANSARVPSGAPFFSNLLPRFISHDEARVTLNPDDSAQNIILPCFGAYQLSRDLAAIKGKGRFAYDALSAADLAAIRGGTKRLVVDLGGEMFFTRPEMIRGLHAGIDEISVRRSDVTVLNGDATAEINYLRHCASENIRDRAHILTLDANPFFLLAHQRMTEAEFTEHVDQIQVQRKARSPKKVFLNFNGRSRSHRVYTVLLLMGYGIFDKGYVSLLDYASTKAGTKLGQPASDDKRDLAATLRQTFASWPDAELCLPHVEKLLELLPLELDLAAEKSIEHNRHAVVTPWQLQDEQLYQGSYISLVTDTLLPKDNTLFVTEKVFKSFLGFHPFIYLGCYRGLERLRSMGFQTFSPFIDESYDIEINGPIRLQKAMRELKRLSALTTAELEDLYNALWPRLLYNARRAYVESPEWCARQLRNNILARLVLPDLRDLAASSEERPVSGYSN